MEIELTNIRIEASELSRRALLEDINIHLKSGEITLLLGCTGSGKTTLLQTLAGLRPPDAGSVTIDGMPFWQEGKVPQSILLQMGLVFQFPEQQLFARNIQREFAYSLRPYRLTENQQREQITNALNQWDPPVSSDGERRFHLDRSPFALSGERSADWVLLLALRLIHTGCCWMSQAPGWKRKVSGCCWMYWSNIVRQMVGSL
ncbi:ATP-binding cassette domain-containing protein [Paenibacillus amylolyticus]|nr:ATP-binding cassette domain-containing protein [Paenibacillus amylolyticus]WFR61462.1 ATP-binding cassette domain-containing protein [Paenibacillus amylolyticus]